MIIRLAVHACPEMQCVWKVSCSCWPGVILPRKPCLSHGLSPGSAPPVSSFPVLGYLPSTLNNYLLVYHSLFPKPSSDHISPVTVYLTLIRTSATGQVAALSSSTSKAFPILSVTSCDKTPGAIMPALTLKEQEAKKHGRQVVSQTSLSLGHLWTRKKNPWDVFWWNGNKGSL